MCDGLAEAIFYYAIGLIFYYAIGLWIGIVGIAIWSMVLWGWRYWKGERDVL